MTHRRRWLHLLVLAAALALGACGPSTGQIKTAREARYRTDANVVFKTVVNTVQGKKYKIINADVAQGALRTEDRWYEPDGTYEDKNASGQGVMAEDGAVVLYFEVRLAGGPTDYQVEVIPRAAQVRAGYTAPYTFAPDDIAMPGWVQGKTDDLYLAIYEALKPYVVTPGG